MRFLNRFIYAVIAALGLYITLNIARENQASAYLKEIAEESLESNQIEHFIATRYYDPDLMAKESITIFEGTYDVYIYNVANIVQSDGYIVIEGFQVLLHHVDGPPMYDVFGIRIATTNNEVFIEREVAQIFDLPIYSFKLNNDLTPIFNKTLFFKDDTYYNVNRLEFFSFDGISNSVDIEIKLDDYNLSSSLFEYINSHNKVPIENQNDFHVSNIYELPFSWRVVRSGVIYLLITIPITYFTFFYKRNKGSLPPTEGLKNDIKNLERH